MRESINRENYEVWLIDYIDNKLTTDERREVESFLELNPDIKEEFNEFETLPLDESIVFENKEQLRKELNDLLPEGFSSLDDFMLANLEGDLDFDQQKKFDVLVKSDKLIEQEYSYYLQTKLNADESIVFPNKAKLKKGVIFNLPLLINQYPKVISIAAILLVLIIAVNISLVQQNLFSSKGIAKTYNIDEVKKQQRLEWSFDTDLNTVNNNIDLDNVHLATLNSPTKTDKSDVVEIKQTIANQQDQQTQVHLAEQNINVLKVDEPSIMSNKFRIEKASTSDVATAASNTTPMTKYLSNQFRERALGEEVSADDNRKLSIWDVADAGLQKIGKLFNRDFRLNKEYNDDGEIIALAFNSPNLGFATPLKKNRP